MKTKAANIIGGLFILLFVYTALSKLLAFEKFRSILRIAPFTAKYATVFAIAIPAAELLISCLLFIPSTVRQGIAAAVGLLLVFTIYLIFMVLTEPNLPCSCGGVIQQMSWKQHIVFNILFIVAGIVGLRMIRKRPAERYQKYSADK